MHRHKLTSMLIAALDGKMFAGPTPAPAPGAQNNLQERDSLEELQAKMVDLHAHMEGLRATADKEHRRITDDEAKQIEDLSDQFDALDDEVKLRERVLAQKDRLSQPTPRKVAPSDLPTASVIPDRQRITGGDVVGASKGSWGFRSVGEFAKAVVTAGKGNGLDPRIVAAATTYGNETTLADGGYAIPPDFRENIVKKIQGEESLLNMTDQQFSSSNRMTVPKDDTTPWATSGGIQAYWDDEAAAMTPSKPSLGQLEVKLNRMTALVPVTDELMEDAPSLSRYLPGKVAEKFTSKLNAAIIGGNGIAKPLGLINSPSVVEQAIEASQDLTPALVFDNITKMWARLYAPLRSGAVWLINQDLEPFMASMVVPGTSPSYPAYLPPGGLSGQQYGTLMGRPVMASEHCSAVGTPGDIILTNLSTYLTIQKVGGVRSDVSMHLYFDQSIVAFRFVMRVGGQSWWSAAATRLNGSNTLSNIITLGTRTA